MNSKTVESISTNEDNELNIQDNKEIFNEGKKEMKEYIHKYEQYDIKNSSIQVKNFDLSGKDFFKLDNLITNFDGKNNPDEFILTEEESKIYKKFIDICDSHYIFV